MKSAHGYYHFVEVVKTAKVETVVFTVPSFGRVGSTISFRLTRPRLMSVWFTVLAVITRIVRLCYPLIYRPVEVTQGNKTKWKSGKETNRCRRTPKNATHVVKLLSNGKPPRCVFPFINNKRISSTHRCTNLALHLFRRTIYMFILLNVYRLICYRNTSDLSDDASGDSSHWKLFVNIPALKLHSKEFYCIRLARLSSRLCHNEMGSPSAQTDWMTT